ncbi:UNVERIFIED_CONTAM: hyaluronan synthase [Gekko kuhli]
MIFLLQMHCERFICILRILGTTLFGVSLLLGISAAYIVGYQFIQTDNYYFSFGLYGAILASHLIIQSLFAFLEHRKMKRSLETPIKLNKTVALCIAAYQEDPDYLRKCLLSVKRLTYPGVKVIMVIDGNSEDDVYMMDIFSEIMGRDKSATYIWRNNFHHKGPEETEESHRDSMQHVTQLVLSNKSVCIMQKWGGKREVMYTAFKALGRSVDYVQVAIIHLGIDVASQFITDQFCHIGDRFSAPSPSTSAA